jgi:hypothetical protein
MGLVVVVSALVWTAAGADAQAKRAKAKAKSKAAPESAEISKSMGDLRWGMSKDEVMRWAIKQIKDRYKEPLAKANDAMNEEIRQVRDSFVRFEGRTTGWDVSFLRDEFTHNTGEAMIVVRDQNSQNFYFFINDRLWKWYKAFDAKVFQGKSFGEFAQAVQGRFGKSTEAQGELVPGGGKRHWLEWQDKSTRLRAVDQTKFYGFYCLVFEEKETVDKLASLRRNAPQRRPETHALVESVTSGVEASQPDHSPDIVDRITGKMRNRPEPAPASASAGKGGGRGASTPSAAAAAEPAVVGGVSAEDDPLRGLDF